MKSEEPHNEMRAWAWRNLAKFSLDQADSNVRRCNKDLLCSVDGPHYFVVGLLK